MLNALLLATALAPASLAGDLWLSFETEGDGGQVKMDIPANWLASEGEPVQVEADGRTVDLRLLARDVQERREGAREVLRFEGDEGQPCELAIQHRKRRRSERRQSQWLTLQLQGQENELSFRLPLQLGQLGLSLAGEGFEAHLRIDELKIPWGAELFLLQLRESSPTTLADLRGEDGSQVLVRTE